MGNRGTELGECGEWGWECRDQGQECGEREWRGEDAGNLGGNAENKGCNTGNHDVNAGNIIEIEKTMKVYKIQFCFLLN